jgi:hypothetical protein
VFFAGSEDHGVARRNILRRIAGCLHANPPFGHQQPLRAGVHVPVGAGTRLELHVVDVHGRPFVVGCQQLRVSRADERRGVSDAKN